MFSSLYHLEAITMATIIRQEEFPRDDLNMPNAARVLLNKRTMKRVQSFHATRVPRYVFINQSVCKRNLSMQTHPDLLSPSYSSPGPSAQHHQGPDPDAAGRALQAASLLLLNILVTRVLARIRRLKEFNVR